MLTRPSAASPHRRKSLGLLVSRPGAVGDRAYNRRDADAAAGRVLFRLIAWPTADFYDAPMVEHRHLRRLDSIWVETPLFFVTTCAKNRCSLFANPRTVTILQDELANAHRRHGWRVGRFVVMPDHVHFFCASDGSPKGASLSRFVGSFKQWTAKRMVTGGVSPPIWQKQFFDHLLRSPRSYDDKWLYVRENPVRAGLVATAEDWPYAGEIAALEL